MKKRILGPIIICVLIGAIIGIVNLNKWIQSQVGDIAEQPAPAVIAEAKPAKKTEAPKIKKKHGEVICKVRLAPERTFETSIFYQGGEEIARHKVLRKGGKVYDQKGDIPNGKVKFINETSQTYGVEYYRNNLRHGPRRTNYKDGQLKNESNYEYGKLITRKEYYIDGVLKMEEDYSDARELVNRREAGIGKTYWRDGGIKYEWYMINSDSVGYSKSYNTKGYLTSAVYYDEYGNEKTPQ